MERDKVIYNLIEEKINEFESQFEEVTSNI